MRLLRLDADVPSGRGACLPCPVRPRRPIPLPCHAPTKSANITLKDQKSRVQYLTTSSSQAKQVAEASCHPSGTRSPETRHRPPQNLACCGTSLPRASTGSGPPNMKLSSQVQSRVLPTLKPSPSAFLPPARRRRAASAVDGMHNCSQAVSQHGAAMGKSALSITSFVSAQAAMTTCRKLQKPPFCRGPPLAISISPVKIRWLGRLRSAQVPP